MIVLPTVQPHEVILIRASHDSGIILNNDNSRYLQTGNDYYRIFDKLEDARNFIREEKQKNALFDYIIYDHNHASVETYL